MKTLLFLLALQTSFCLSAQSLAMSRQIHQSFELSEDVSEIRFDLPNTSYDLIDMDTLKFSTKHLIEPWAGNTILIETTISISQGRAEILDFFIKEGRYQLNIDSSSAMPLLVENSPKRKVLRTKDGPCAEQILYRILIPDNFEWQGTMPSVAVRKKED